MKDSECITSVRYAALLNTSDPDYTDARIRIELWNMLIAALSESVQRARAGYWRQSKTYTVSASQRGIRIPARALANAFDVVEIASSDGQNYNPLDMLDLRGLGRVESRTGTPTNYIVDGDFINLYPLATSSVGARVKFPIRPSSIVQEQTAGLITAINTSTRVVTVNSIPTVRSTAAAVATGTLIDIVHPAGGFELGLYDISPTVAGADITLPAGTDMTRIAVGDYVRGAQETDWPMLPEEFHRTLCDATAAKICMNKGQSGKAQMLSASVAPDMERLRSIIQPRAKYDPRALRRRNYFTRFPWTRDPWGTA